MSTYIQWYPIYIFSIILLFQQGWTKTQTIFLCLLHSIRWKYSRCLLHIFHQNLAREPNLVSLETWGFSPAIKYISVDLNITWPHNMFVKKSHQSFSAKISASAFKNQYQLNSGSSMTEGWRRYIRGRDGPGPRQGGVRERQTQSKTLHLKEILNRAVLAHSFSLSVIPSVCWACVSTQLHSFPPFLFTSSTLLFFLISPPFFFVETLSRVSSRLTFLHLLYMDLLYIQ